jgi:2-keto-myo-inositol isomerase
MKPALAQVCSLNSAFETDVKDYAAGQCGAIEVWFTKLETFLQSHSTAEVRRLLDEQQVETPVASYQGGLLSSQGASREEAWRLFESRLELCQQLQVRTIVVACDVVGPLKKQDVDRVRMSLKQAAERAESSGVRLALEFQAGSDFGNNLQTAAALVEETGNSHLGICLDVFHYYVGPSKPDDLGLLNHENLFHVQLCDLADVPREFATDSHRILPGEGDIPLEPILHRLGEIEYERCVSIELMNPQIWQVPALQFGEIAMTALRRVLGQASME